MHIHTTLQCCLQTEDLNISLELGLLQKTFALKPAFDVCTSPTLFYNVGHLLALLHFSLQACVFHCTADSPYSPASQVGVVF